MVNKYISRILENIELRKHVDYASKESVKEFNKQYDQIAQDIAYIATHYPEKMDVLFELTKHSDSDVVAHCAPVILKLDICTKEQKKKALEAIKKLVEGDDLDDVQKLGFSISLRRWEKELEQL